MRLFIHFILSQFKIAAATIAENFVNERTIGFATIQRIGVRIFLRENETICTWSGERGNKALPKSIEKAKCFGVFGLSSQGGLSKPGC